MQTLLTPDDALASVLEHAAPLPPEPIALEDAVGLALAEDARAESDHPPFDRAMMDGFAVRLADAGGTPLVVAVVAAGAPTGRELAAGALTDGRCVEIMTGAPCPPGTEAVVKVEDTRREGDRVVLPRGVRPGQNIAPRGSECPSGALVLRPGVVVTPLVAATLAALGRTFVRVHRRPRVAVISTGSELVAPGEPLRPGQIHDSNGLMLSLMAREAGLSAVALARAGDTPAALAAALAAQAAADVVLLSGGVSMGRYDLVPAALAAAGADAVFHKVRQKPGKPLLFAHRGARLFFGLPGNPLSSHLGFHRYVAAALRRMAGLPAACRVAEGVLAAPLRTASERVEFVLARAEDAEGGARVTPLPGRGSADLFTAATANAFVRIDPGQPDLAAGARTAFEWIGERRWATS